MYFIQQNTFAQQLLQGLPFLDLTTLGLGASSKQTFCGLFFLPSSGKASLAPKVVRIEDSQQATAAAYKARVIKARKSKSQIGLISSGPFWCLFVGESLIRKKKTRKGKGRIVTGTYNSNVVLAVFPPKELGCIFRCNAFRLRIEDSQPLRCTTKVLHQRCTHQEANLCASTMQQLFGEKQTQPLREVQSKVVISVAPHFSSFRKEQSSRTRFYDKGFCQSSMDTRRCCIFRWKRSFATNIFGVPTKPFHQTPNLQQKDSRYSCHLAVAIRRFATKVVQLPCTEGGYSVSAGPSKIDKSLEQGSAEGATPLVVQRSALSESLIRQQAQVLGGASTIKKILYNEIAVDVDSSTVTARKRKTFLSIMNRQYQEKRKLSLIYGYLPHKQINRLVNKALHFQKKLSFTTSQHFFNLLEGRADIILYRSGFAANVYAAKKMVSHGLVKINDRVITTPSIVLSPGDILSVSSSALSHIIRFLSLNRKQRKIHKPLNAPARRGGFSKLRRTARGFSQSMIDNRPKILSYKDCSFFFRPKLKRKPKRISRRKKKSKKRFPS